RDAQHERHRDDTVVALELRPQLVEPGARETGPGPDYRRARAEEYLRQFSRVVNVRGEFFGPRIEHLAVFQRVRMDEVFQVFADDDEMRERPQIELQVSHRAP